MSTQSTRLPLSAKAAARFSVVVVFATPPFWFAKAMTFAFEDSVTDDSELSISSYRRGKRPMLHCVFVRVWKIPSGERATRQATRGRHGQGRRRPDDRRGVPRPGRRARGQARDDRRGGTAGTLVAGVPARGRRLLGDEAVGQLLRDVGRPATRPRRVPQQADPR